MTKVKIASLFSGCGGLDLGFTNAGFEMVYANDFDKVCWETFEKNHGVKIDGRSITDVKSDEIPDVDGIIGGPPCQSWSLAGAMRGIKDERGQLFYQYIRILKDKKPKFFLAENVPGLISSAHIDEFNKIILEFEKLGYNVTYKLLDARNYGVPQVEAMKSEKKIRKLYKTFTPYITNNSTAEKTAIESDFVKSDDIMQSNDYSGQSIEIKTTQSEVYKAILPSDGISLIVPKDKSKIALAKYLLERLENEIDAKNKKE